MGRIGKNKTLISISIPKEWREEIDRRAAALSLTRAAYATMIIERWWNEGCQAISEPDRLMQITGTGRQELDGSPRMDEAAMRQARERSTALTNKPRPH